jgi:hypothetical protein
MPIINDAKEFDILTNHGDILVLFNIIINIMVAAGSGVTLTSGCTSSECAPKWRQPCDQKNGGVSKAVESS